MNSNYVILSDGSCDLPSNILAVDQVVPFSISLNGRDYYKEDVDINIDEFYKQLPGIYPKTSVPSVVDFTDKFLPFLEKGKDILCLTISSYLSSSFQSATIAAEMMKEEYPDRKIHVVDSLHATASLGLVVKEALYMQENGQVLDEVWEYTKRASEIGGVNFVVGDTSYLNKGGRLGRAVLQTGKTLHLSPLISFTKGENHVKGMVRGQKSSCYKLLKLCREYLTDKNISSDELIFTVGYSDEGSLDQCKKLKEMLIEEFGAMQVSDMIRIGVTITAHTGPGTFGVGFALKHKN